MITTKITTTTIARIKIILCPEPPEAAVEAAPVVAVEAPMFVPDGADPGMLYDPACVPRDMRALAPDPRYVPLFSPQLLSDHVLHH